jgi:ubiquinone/menaquinone biosynthesis C-methylase UbiE
VGGGLSTGCSTAAVCTHGVRVTRVRLSAARMTKDRRELFSGSAQYYARYRLGYPKELFDELIGAFELNKSKRVLDIGCGTGQLALPLAQYVKEVVGLDIERDMLEEAERQADAHNISNIRWVHERAEDIPDALGKFHLSTMGTSFHWMEQEIVLRRIYNVTERGGGVAIISNKGLSAWTDVQKQDETWKEKRKQVIQKYLGEKRRAGTGFYNEPKKRFEDLLEESLFTRTARWAYEWNYEWDISSIIGNLYSTSYASRKLLGDRCEDFEKDLADELLKANPDGRFIDHIYTEALLAWKD